MPIVFFKAKSKDFCDKKQCLQVPLRKTLSLNDLNAKKPKRFVQVLANYSKLILKKDMH